MVTQFKLEGPIPTVYDGYLKAEEALWPLRPQAVKLHSWPSSKAADAVGRIKNHLHAIPMSGLGVDGIARDVAQGRKTVSQGVEEFRRIVRECAEMGSEAVEFNAEADWKRPPNSEEAGKIHDLVTNALKAVAADYPNLPFGHTAYDHPTYHSTYPWKSWLGPGSPIAYSAPQVYAAPEGGLMARAKDLSKREARALNSWSIAIRKGWLREDAEEGTAGDLLDLDWYPYYQLHHVPATATILSAIEHKKAFLWAFPTRTDEQGLLAAGVLLTLWRKGYWGVNAIRRWQTDHDLKVDGIPGRITIDSVISESHR